MGGKMKPGLLIYTFLLGYSLSYDELVIPNFTTAEMSTTLQDFVASRTVDGRPDLLRMIEDRSCSHSGLGQQSAWLRIDLGKVYSLYQVQTWYRNDREPRAPNTERFVGYTIRISNDTAIPPQEICFRHNLNQRIPIPTLNDCVGTARYVWFYKDRPVPQEGVILEICEVQISGCEVNHYGPNCTACGIGCGTCNINFGCADCLPGHVEPECECPFGLYGLGCTRTCSGRCADDENCEIETGQCRNGCTSGYLGIFCNETDPLIAPPPQAASGSVIAGTITGILVAIIVIAVAMVFVNRLRKKQTPEYKDFVFRRSLKINRGGTNSSAKLVDNLPDEQDNRSSHNSDGGSSLYCNTSRDSFFLTSKVIKVCNISNAIKAKSRDSFRIFQKEFKDVPHGEQSEIPCTVAKEPRHKTRNRFKTTFPYDHSRVILRSSENDYINANFIKDIDGSRKFIASQGPKINTLADHWIMIWQENISVVVMLTNLVEGSKKKCEQYWPESEEEMAYGNITVRLMQEKRYANYVIRQLQLRQNSESLARNVSHMHYTHWPDHGVPDPVDLMIFHKHMVRIQQRSKDNPLLVHCSAGIGRTGTFIALDVLFRHGSTHGRFNVVDYIKTMRKDRMSMIQNVDQYVFLHFALNESFKGNERLMDKASFVSEQSQNQNPTSESKLAQEFKALIAIKKSYIEADKESGTSHKELNYNPDVLPIDRYRAALSSYVEGRSDYYNAVFVSSFCEYNNLITAQYPVEGQAEDFLRLLMDHDSNTLVSINPLRNIPSTLEWFPRENPISLTSCVISRKSSSDITPSVRETEITIKTEESEVHHVKIYELATWKIDDVIPRDLQMINDVIKHVMNNDQSASGNPITIVSKDGATGCGVLCAVYNAIQQLQQDDEVDMFTIARQLQIRRPEMISSVEEYSACHKIVASALADSTNGVNSSKSRAADDIGVYGNVENVYAN
ncbi:receptor-type tyrosine-protein phosphatase epsilon-like isoform X2 [Ostrea edulis]|uniref:receptor-type tyrosine-protein phosphatase epsilon-like isoform X2 n=1 Tax=Ostrea edulis TaxID=37623 RepID=UPI0024AE96CD|nr:receptor-type tyrosine-protein phosphatase epsilon-like isoform X2 [Ostrea edulis]